MIHEELTGRKIKRVCEEKGLTVQEIQRRMGIGAHQSIYNWFNGKAMPTLDNYYTLCRILGVPMESMIVEDRGDLSFESDEEVPEMTSEIEENQISPISAVICWSDHFMELIRLLGRAERFRADIRKRIRSESF